MRFLQTVSALLAGWTPAFVAATAVVTYFFPGAPLAGVFNFLDGIGDRRP